MLRQYALAFSRSTAAKLPSRLKTRTRNGFRNVPRFAEGLSDPRRQEARGGHSLPGVIPERASAGALSMSSDLGRICTRRTRPGLVITVYPDRRAERIDSQDLDVNYKENS